MAAAKVNLSDIEIGATYKYTIIWKDSDGVPIDLTGSLAKLHIRPTKDSATLLLELSTENSRIILTPLLGQIDLYISDETTDTLVSDNVSKFYDLKIYHPNGEETRLIEGKVKFSPGVTKDV